MNIKLLADTTELLLREVYASDELSSLKIIAIMEIQSYKKVQDHHADDYQTF